MDKPNSSSEDKDNDSEGEESMVQGLDDEVITVGQSDTQDETSGGSDGEMSQVRMSDNRKGTHKPVQMHVKDSWEDYSILNGEVEIAHEDGASKHSNEDDSSNRDGDNEDTQTHTGSIVDEDDKEYEPTSTDSEESAVSIKKKKSTNKKQTTITNTFHLSKSELRAMIQKKGNNKQLSNKRQTRSMRTNIK